MFIKPKRKVTKVYLHHSASDNPAHDDVSVIMDWHLQRGFSDVGYHYFIKKNGIIQKGRGLEKIPAAQKGHNPGSIAICLSGLASFTDEQKDALVGLCGDINSKYDKITFHGHKEVGNTQCPHYDYKRWLVLDKKGRVKLFAKPTFWQRLFNIFKGV